MTRKLEITPEAERDIFAIVSNIRLQDSLASAKHAAFSLNQFLLNLANHQDSGRAGGCDGTKEVVITGFPFIAIYQSNKDMLTIVRVLYGAEEHTKLQT